MTAKLSFHFDRGAAILDMRFIDGPLTLRGATCTATLYDEAGAVVATATARDGKVSFALPGRTVEEAKTLRLECEYRQGDVLRLRFEV